VVALQFQLTLTSIAAAAEMSGTTPTPAIVTKLATDEYDQRTLGGGKAHDESFAADTWKKRDVKCFNCKKRGHVITDCWAKGGGKEGQGPKKCGGRGRGRGARQSGASGDAAAATKQGGSGTADIEAWAAITEAGEDDDDAAPLIPAMAADEVAHAETELYDSGASRHMTPYRERFVTYREIPACPITAASDFPARLGLKAWQMAWLLRARAQKLDSPGHYSWPLGA